ECDRPYLLLFYKIGFRTSGNKQFPSQSFRIKLQNFKTVSKAANIICHNLHKVGIKLFKLRNYIQSYSVASILVGEVGLVIAERNAVVLYQVSDFFSFKKKQRPYYLAVLPLWQDTL